MSIEVDRKRVDLLESNELSLYDSFEATHKHDLVLAVRKQLNDDLKLDLIKEVDRKRTELSEFNELSHYESAKVKQKNGTALSFRNQLD